MHIITDENGNPIPHGSDSHSHSHEHSHDGHSHEHGHSHDDHGHSHEHPHTHDHHGEPGHEDCDRASCEGCRNADADPKAQLTALLTYMLQHNQSHAAELDQLSEKIREAGMADAAEQIRKGVDEFQKGNMYLSLALSMIKEP